MNAAYTGENRRAQDRRAVLAASKREDDKKWVERAEGDRRVVEQAGRESLTPPASKPNCREPDGRCGICGGWWAVCGCQGMLDRDAAKATGTPDEGLSRAEADHVR